MRHGVVIVMVGVLVWVAVTQITPHTESQSVTITASSANSTQDANRLSHASERKVELKNTALTPTTATLPKVETVVDGAPDAETLREEAMQDPHVTSSALVLFSISLAPRLEEAIQHPETAETFYRELSDCVNGHDSRLTPPVRALCLTNALRLGQQLSSLQARAQAMWQNADPEVKRLAN